MEVAVVDRQDNPFVKSEYPLIDYKDATSIKPDHVFVSYGFDWKLGYTDRVKPNPIEKPERARVLIIK